MGLKFETISDIFSVFLGPYKYPINNRLKFEIPPLLSPSPHLSYIMDKSNVKISKTMENCAPFCAP